MALIEGTTGTDILIGTDDDDILRPFGTTVGGDLEILRGKLGADTYDLQRSASAEVYNFRIFDDNSDGAADAITNVGALYHSASLGYQGWASAVRIGDKLVIDTPGKPYRFRDPAQPSYHIEIIDHYGNGTVETIQAGGVTYALPTGGIGTLSEDIMAGSNAAEVLSSLDGNDWVYGNGGSDTIDAGAGDDVVFGGAGRDRIVAGAGDDRVFGEGSHDVIWGGDGHDWIEAGDGRDRIWGGDGFDRMLGGAGNDLLRGQSGQDMLIGDAGDDRLYGGREGDTYQFTAGLGDPGWGHDTIRDDGNKPSYLNTDIIELRQFYGPSDGSTAEACARLSFVRDGDDMVMSADDGAMSLRVERMFDANANRYFIEHLKFDAGYWTPVTFQILNGDVDRIGDDRAYPGGYGGEAHELMFGTDAGDDFFGNSGTNFIWTGAGADVLIYKENDPQVWPGYGGGASQDIVEDFDITFDLLDFREVSAASMADLTIGADDDGDATIHWDSGTWEIADILIELRGVAQADVTADLFVFV